MANAAIYIRVSTEDQVGNNSLTTQLAACRSYAVSQGLTVIATLSDDETGANTNRPGYLELRRLVQERLVSAVIVYAVDRLHRNLANQIVGRSEFQQAGVDIHYVQRGKLSNTPEGVLFDNIDGTFAEYERHKIRERTMRGTEGKVQSGRVIGAGRPPYGYDYTGTGRDRMLTINEEQAVIVREIFTRYVAGENIIVIVRDLSARRIPTWSDIHGIANKQRRQRDPFTWNTGTLYDLLHDELYAGMWQQFRNRVRNGAVTRTKNPGDWVGVPTPPIVDRPLWQAAQDKLTAGQKVSTRNVRYDYALRSMIRCGVCGGAMIGTTQKRPNTQQSYYRCNNNNAGKAVVRCVDSPYVRAERVDAAVWAFIKERLSMDALVQEQARQNELRANLSQHSEAEQATLTHRRDTLQSQIDRLVALYGRGVVDIDSIERQVAPIREQIAELTRQLTMVTPTVVLAPVDLLALGREMEAGIAHLDTNLIERRGALLDLRVKVTVKRLNRKQSELTITSLVNSDPLTVVV